MSDPNENKNKISNAALYTIMILMMAFGTANTLILKYQDDFQVGGVDRNGDPKQFNHPYFQCANMFLGEFVCLFVYAAKVQYLKCKNKKTQDDPQSAQDAVPLSPGAKIAEEVELKRNINVFWFAIPAAFDCTASSLMFVALTQCAASVYQMMRGAIVVITAFFSVVFLKKKQYAHHITSMIIIVGGVALVGWASLAFSKDDDSSSS